MAIGLRILELTRPERCAARSCCQRSIIQVNWDNPTARTWRISDRNRNELLHVAISELQVEIGDKWLIVVEARAI